MSISNCEPSADFGELSMKSKASKFSGRHSNVQKNLHKVLLKTKNICFFVVLFMMFLPCLALGEMVTVLWDPNPEPDIAGYKVFYGTSSGNYTDCITVNSTQTSCEVTGLQGGNTYYFAVKAVDASGQESEFSSEVSKYTGKCQSRHSPL
jgi:hypothetical protein